MVALAANPTGGLTATVPEPEAVFKEVSRLAGQLKLARQQLRLSEQVHGRPALLSRCLDANGQARGKPGAN